MSPRQRIAYPVFLVLATGLALALVEGATRTVIRLRAGAWPTTRAVAEHRDNLAVHGLFRRHPWLNVSGRASASAEVQGKSAVLSSAGYRSPERPTKKPHGVLRVLCAGGSTTFDSLAESNETSWPWRLEETLREGGLAVEVWNAGLPTWTTLENTVALLARDLELEPDLVVLLQGFNDLQPAAHDPHDPTYEHGHAERMRTALGFELEPPSVLARSVVLERLRGLVERDEPAAGAESDRATRAEGVSEAGLDTYRRNLRSLIAIARAHGAGVLVVTQPLRPQPSESAADRRFLEEWLGLEAEAVEAELARFNRALVEVAVSEGAAVLDAVTVTEWQREDFWDPVHFATEGSDKLARLLADPVATALAVAPVEAPTGDDR